jgi:hypothetical protein
MGKGDDGGRAAGMDVGHAALDRLDRAGGVFGAGLPGESTRRFSSGTTGRAVAKALGGFLGRGLGQGTSRPSAAARAARSAGSPSR